MNSFMGTKEIMERYGIKKTLAAKHKKRILEMYEIDTSRLPKKGLIPAKVVLDYFEPKCKKKMPPSESASLKD